MMALRQVTDMIRFGADKTNQKSTLNVSPCEVPIVSQDPCLADENEPEESNPAEDVDYSNNTTDEVEGTELEVPNNDNSRALPAN